MYFVISILFLSYNFIDGKHFNGGIIAWAPINPYGNNTSVDITIAQTYSWTYSYIECANNMPISTAAFASANVNLTCIGDCSTDGGYSAAPIDILTDCVSASSSMQMVQSKGSKAVTLSADSYFYLAYQGSSWRPLNSPATSGLAWSIVTYIDLRKRPDGFINTSPVVRLVSPQYAFVNKTIKIKIPVSDVNTGDDIRCRWSTYTSQYGRRKRSYVEESFGIQKAMIDQIQIGNNYNEILGLRKKRRTCQCSFGKSCTSTSCQTSTCTGSQCLSSCCDFKIEKRSVTNNTTLITTVSPSTSATVAPLNSTSTYSMFQALDECGDICFPNNIPNDTTLSNCVVTFTGRQAGVWYAVAIQVEDFMNSSSTIPMSSVPAQMLIYVQPEPTCSNAPIIFPLAQCLQVQVGVPINFNLSLMNLCNESVVQIADIFISSVITGMTRDNLTSSPINSSIYDLMFSWTPQTNQIGSQELCMIAYTTENLQSDEYCVTFTVKNSSDICTTTTTTSTMTTTSATSKTTTSSTSTTSTTTTTLTTSTTTSTTTAMTSATSLPMALILCLSFMGLLLCLCCAGCCLYRLLWAPDSQHRRRKINKNNKSKSYIKIAFITNNLKKLGLSKRTFKGNLPIKHSPIEQLMHIDNKQNNASLFDQRACTPYSNFSKQLNVAKTANEFRVSPMISIKRIKRSNNVTPQLDYKNQSSSINIHNTSAIKNNEVMLSSQFTMIQMPTFYEGTLHNSTSFPRKSLSAPTISSSIHPSRFDQINIIKIPRIQSTVTEVDYVSNVRYERTLD